MMTMMMMMMMMKVMAMTMVRQELFLRFPVLLLRLLGFTSIGVSNSGKPSSFQASRAA